MPGLLALIEGDPRAAATGSTICREADAGEMLEARGMSSPAFVLPPELEAAEPPERRGVARDEVRLMVVARRSGELVHASFRDLPAFLEPGRPRRDQQLGDPSRRVPGRLLGRGEEVELACLPRAGMDGGAGGRRAAQRRRRRPYGAPVRAGSSCPAGRRRRSRPLRGRRAPRSRRADPRPLDDTCCATGTRSVTATSPRLPLPAYQTAFALVPGSRGDAERGAAVHAGPRHRARRARLHRPGHAPRGRLLAGAKRGAGTPSASGARADRSPGHRDPRLGRARDRRRHHRRAGARDRGRGRRLGGGGARLDPAR